MKIYIGIDPGKSGGIVGLNEERGVIQAERMPDSEGDILQMLGLFKGIGDSHAWAILELVRASPQMGVVSAFTFGKGYGGLRMALVASGIPFDEVVPVKWQNAMQCRSGGDKSITKRRAQELFPGLKVTNYIADALLLAEYCRRVNVSRAA